MPPYTYDFHIHSALSPCADMDMTPANIVNMAGLAGLSVIAIADHNSARNCRAAMEVGAQIGVTVLPAMELTTAEEVHILCLFDSLAGAEDFSAYVYGLLPDYPVDTRLYNPQIVYDADDCEIERIEKLLTVATPIGTYDAAALLRQYGGVAIPAHINRPAFSLLANLAFMDPSMGFSLVELNSREEAAALQKTRKDLKGYPYIISSDAHSLTQIPDGVHTICAPHPSLAALLGGIQDVL